MNTLLLLVVALVTALMALLGCLAMAGWSDRRIARAWQEWVEEKAQSGTGSE